MLVSKWDVSSSHKKKTDNIFTNAAKPKSDLMSVIKAKQTSSIGLCLTVETEKLLYKCYPCIPTSNENIKSYKENLPKGYALEALSRYKRPWSIWYTNTAGTKKWTWWVLSMFYFRLWKH